MNEQKLDAIADEYRRLLELYVPMPNSRNRTGILNMSDTPTPRTDAAHAFHSEHVHYVTTTFARTLERELTVANATIAELREERKEIEDAIKYDAEEPLREFIVSVFDDYIVVKTARDAALSELATVKEELAGKDAEFLKLIMERDASMLKILTAAKREMDAESEKVKMLRDALVRLDDNSDLLGCQCGETNICNKCQCDGCNARTTLAATDDPK